MLVINPQGGLGSCSKAAKVLSQGLGLAVVLVVGGWNSGSQFDRHPQRLPIFHLILGGRSESLLRKPGFPW